MSYNENLISDQIDAGLQYERDLRDHFAGLAMQSLINNDQDSSFELISADAYSIADCMLKSRKGVKP